MPVGQSGFEDVQRSSAGGNTDMAAFYKHVSDTHLNPHPQYRLAATAITSADIQDGTITQADVASASRFYTICTSGTRPGSPTTGDLIFETDTLRAWFWNGSAWRFAFGTAANAYVYRTTVIILSTSTATAVQFVTGFGGAELRDSDGIHDLSSNTTRLTVPSSLPGMWRFSYSCSFAANATGLRAAWLHLNGGTTNRYAASFVPAVSAVDATEVCGSIDFPMAAGDYMELIQWQASGGNLNGFGSNVGDHFEATYIGPT
jgi:hypothetical protein